MPIAIINFTQSAWEWMHDQRKMFQDDEREMRAAHIRFVESLVRNMLLLLLLLFFSFRFLCESENSTRMQPTTTAGDDLRVIYRISFIKWVYVRLVFFFRCVSLRRAFHSLSIYAELSFTKAREEWRQFLHGIWWHLYSFIYVLKCVTLRFLRHSFSMCVWLYVRLYFCKCIYTRIKNVRLYWW